MTTNPARGPPRLMPWGQAVVLACHIITSLELELVLAWPSWATSETFRLSARRSARRCFRAVALIALRLLSGTLELNVSSVPPGLRSPAPAETQRPARHLWGQHQQILQSIQQIHCPVALADLHQAQWLARILYASAETCSKDKALLVCSRVLYDL